MNVYVTREERANRIRNIYPVQRVLSPDVSTYAQWKYFEWNWENYVLIYIKMHMNKVQ